MKLAWVDGRSIVERCARINELLNKPAYTDQDKTEIEDLLRKLGMTDADDGGRYAVLHQERGRLLRRPTAGGVEIIASGRASWVGGVQLKSKPVDEWRWEVPHW